MGTRKRLNYISNIQYDKYFNPPQVTEKNSNILQAEVLILLYIIIIQLMLFLVLNKTLLILVLHNSLGLFSAV